MTVVRSVSKVVSVKVDRVRYQKLFQRKLTGSKRLNRVWSRKPSFGLREREALTVNRQRSWRSEDGFSDRRSLKSEYRIGQAAWR